MIVLDEYWIFNEEGFCFVNEFVMYKVFDVIGDFYMCGYVIIGEFCVYKLGYGFNN